MVPAGIDPTVPHPARVYDYILGGTNHFPSDRELAEHMAVAIGGLDELRSYAVANRELLGRAVRYLVHEAGVRQFLDIGTGVPAADNVHGVAQAEAPDSVVVYVDHDPIVVAHAETLLASTPQGATAFIKGDLREPRDIILRAEATLDLTQPVAIMLISIVHLIGDQEDPHGAVRTLLDAVPSGSYLVLTHMATDLEAEKMARFQETPGKVAHKLPFDFAMRSRDEIARFLDGLELVEPGLVMLDDWRPDPASPPDRGIVPLYAAVARKP